VNLSALANVWPRAIELYTPKPCVSPTKLDTAREAKRKQQLADWTARAEKSSKDKKLDEAIGFFKQALALATDAEASALKTQLATALRGQAQARAYRLDGQSRKSQQDKKFDEAIGFFKRALAVATAAEASALKTQLAVIHEAKRKQSLDKAIADAEKTAADAENTADRPVVEYAPYQLGIPNGGSQVVKLEHHGEQRRLYDSALQRYAEALKLAVGDERAPVLSAEKALAAKATAAQKVAAEKPIADAEKTAMVQKFVGGAFHLMLLCCCCR